MKKKFEVSSWPNVTSPVFVQTEMRCVASEPSLFVSPTMLSYLLRLFQMRIVIFHLVFAM